jgi:sugar lactone lactonase YvrE
MVMYYATKLSTTYTTSIHLSIIPAPVSTSFYCWSDDASARHWMTQMGRNIVRTMPSGPNNKVVAAPKKHPEQFVLLLQGPKDGQIIVLEPGVGLSSVEPTDGVEVGQ